MVGPRPRPPRRYLPRPFGFGWGGGFGGGVGSWRVGSVVRRCFGPRAAGIGVSTASASLVEIAWSNVIGAAVGAVEAEAADALVGTPARRVDSDFAFPPPRYRDLVRMRGGAS